MAHSDKKMNIKVFRYWKGSLDEHFYDKKHKTRQKWSELSESEIRYKIINLIAKGRIAGRNNM